MSFEHVVNVACSFVRYVSFGNTELLNATHVTLGNTVDVPLFPKALLIIPSASTATLVFLTGPISGGTTWNMGENGWLMLGGKTH